MGFQELTDEQWVFLAPLLPPKAKTGRPRVDDRDEFLIKPRAWRCERQAQTDQSSRRGDLSRPPRRPS